MTETATETRERVDAFHALGTKVPEGMGVLEALEHAHMLGWNVRKEPLVARIPSPGSDGRMVAVPGKHVVLRDSPFTGSPEPLGVVGDKWTAFQNEQTVGLLTDIVDQSEAELTTVGVLGGGRKTFVSMRLPSHLEFRSPVTGEVDRTELYLSVFNSHDGTGALSCVLSPLRLMCCNQQRMAERHAKSRFTLRHSGNPTVKLAEVRNLLGLTWKYQDTFAAECQRLIDREMAEAEVLSALAEVFDVAKAETELQKSRRTETASQVYALYQNSETVAPFRGTAFGAYNAVTEYADHFMRVGRKGNEVEQRATRTLTSDILGDLKGKAFDVLLPA